MKRLLTILCGVTAALAMSSEVRADTRSTLAREAAEAVVARFGGRAASKGVPALAARIETCAARYGDDTYLAVRQVGPKALDLAERAGVNGTKVTRVLATHGTAAETAVLARPKAMAQFLQYGDEAGSVLVRHPGVAEKVIETAGASGIRAMATLGPQSGRRVAILLENEFAKSPAQHPALLEVIGRYGQKACDFCWDNKAVLAGAAAMTAFIATPEPFLNGTASLAKVAGETGVGMAKVAGERVAAPVVGGIFSTLGWLIALLGVLAVLAVALVWKYGLPSPASLKAAASILRGGGK